MNHIGKWIFKKTMEPYLPKKVIYRPKTGFGAPMRHWVKYELKDFIDENLNKNSLESRGLFEPSAVKTLIDDTRNDKIDASYTIFSLLCIEIWCRQHLDGLNKLI